MQNLGRSILNNNYHVVASIKNSNLDENGDVIKKIKDYQSAFNKSDMVFAGISNHDIIIVPLFALDITAKKDCAILNEYFHTLPRTL